MAKQEPKVKQINREIAIDEVEKWLTYKKVSDKKRTARADNIESLIDAVEEGYLILNDDMSFTQLLKFPTEGEKSISDLTFQPRLKVGSIHNHLQGIKSSDGDGRMCAYVCALTRMHSGFIKSLDTEDYSIAESIAIFFL
jgi:hypothetical protein